MIKENQSFFNKLNIISDILIFLISNFIAYILRFIILSDGIDTYGVKLYIIYSIIAVPVYIFILYLFKVYSSFRKKSVFKEMIYILCSNSLLFTISISFLYFFKFQDVSRLFILFTFTINFSITVVKRLILRNLLIHFRKEGYNQKNSIIIGSGKNAAQVLKTIRANRQYGYKYLGFISNNTNFNGTHIGNIDDTYNILTRLKPDEVFCALSADEIKYFNSIADTCEKTGTKLSIIPFCYEYISSNPSTDLLGNIPIINMRNLPLDNVGNAFLKRFMDIICSLIMLIILSPLLLIATIGIKLTSKGPIIFKQTRVGLNKKEFTMYKFRSMIVNKDQNTAWSKNTDHRKTKFGAFIRKFSIDELPQLFNVLKGDMSLVGPRPEIPFFVDKFKDKVSRYMVKHQVKPGITGLAQIKGFRGDTSIIKRIEYDIEYIENWTFITDIKILFMTALKGFKNNEKIVNNKAEDKSDEDEKLLKMK